MTTQDQMPCIPPTPVHRPIPFLRHLEEPSQKHGFEFASAELSIMAASARGERKGSKVSVLHFLNKRDKRM